MISQKFDRIRNRIRYLILHSADAQDISANQSMEFEIEFVFEQQHLTNIHNGGKS